MELKLLGGRHKNSLSNVPSFEYTTIVDGTEKSTIQKLFHPNYRELIHTIAIKFLLGMDKTKGEGRQYNLLAYENKFLVINKYQPRTKHFVDYLPFFSTPLCNKCPYAKTCPFFIQSQGCHFIAKIIDANRQVDKFAQALRNAVQVFSMGSTAFTTNQTQEDLDVLCFLIAAYAKTHNDQERKDTRLPATHKNKIEPTPLKRKIIYHPENQKVKQQQQEIERRWASLGIRPKKKTSIEYYPKI